MRMEIRLELRGIVLGLCMIRSETRGKKGKKGPGVLIKMYYY
jgi:hypothetical protein